MLRSIRISLRTRIGASLMPTRGLSKSASLSTGAGFGRVVSSIGGRKISVHEHHNVNEVDDQIPLMQYEDEHAEADIHDDLHEKAIAIDAAHASEFGQIPVLPSSSSKHQKVRTLESD
ncbi:hypothetical protein LPJ56_003181 [Coemansia sp. RSA 2599]|nr:hypothetical protein LPJ56_003181 [Coemansia sp. RSA 2599]